jgi:hypothetical protein
MNNREFIPEKLRDDYTYMLAAVTYNGTLFQFASKRLRNNHAIILAALKTSHDILEHAGDYLQNNRNFFMDMIKKSDDEVLWYGKKYYSNDREIVLISVMNKGFSVRHASNELQNDYEIMMAAVKNCGMSLQFASTELKNNREIVCAAITNDAFAWNYASPELKHDREIVLIAIAYEKINPYNCPEPIFSKISPELQHDREIVLAAVAKSGDLIKHTSHELKNDREIVLTAIKNNGYAIQHLPDTLRDDYEIGLEAITNTTVAIKKISENLVNSRMIAMTVLKRGKYTSYVPKHFKTDSNTLYHYMSNGYTIDEVLTKISNDNELVLASLSHNTKKSQLLSDDHEFCTYMLIHRAYELTHGRLNNFHEYYRFSIRDYVKKHMLVYIKNIVSDFNNYKYGFHQYLKLLFNSTSRQTKNIPCVSMLKKLGKYPSRHIVNNIQSYLFKKSARYFLIENDAEWNCELNYINELKYMCENTQWY